MSRFLRPLGTVMTAALIALVAAQPAEARKCHKVYRKHCCKRQCCYTYSCNSCCTSVSNCCAPVWGSSVVSPAPMDAGATPTESAPAAPEDVAPAPTPEPYAPAPTPADAKPAEPAPPEPQPAEPAAEPKAAEPAPNPEPPPAAEPAAEESAQEAPAEDAPPAPPTPSKEGE